MRSPLCLVSYEIFLWVSFSPPSKCQAFQEDSRNSLDSIKGFHSMSLTHDSRVYMPTLRAVSCKTHILPNTADSVQVGGVLLTLQLPYLILEYHKQTPARHTEILIKQSKKILSNG